MASSEISRRTLLGGGAGLAATAALILTGCTTTSTEGGKTVVRYTFMASTKLGDTAKVEAAINAVLKKKGKTFTVKLDPLDSETFSKRVPLALTAGNAGDVVFTAPWANDFYRSASTGNYKPLDDLLNGPAKALKASLPAQYWSAPTVNGKIYAVVNQQLFPGTFGFIAQKAVADKYGINPDEITKFEDLTPMLTAIKKGQPDLTVLYSDNTGNGWFQTPEYFGWDGTLNTFGLNTVANDPKVKLFNIFETDEYRSMAELAYKWRKAGFFADTPPSATDATAAWNGAQIALRFTQADRSYSFPFPVAQKNMVPPILTTGSMLGTLSAISRNTKSPEAAIGWIEALNTDKEIYNLMCFGIEGTNYTFTDKALGVVESKGEGNGWNPNSDWMFGNQFNAYYRTLEEGKANRWKVEDALNRSALASTALGFTFDPDKVKTQVATVSSVVAERNTQLLLGQVDPSTGLPDTISRLKAAGIDDIKKEAQTQIDAWLDKK